MKKIVSTTDLRAISGNLFKSHAALIKQTSMDPFNAPDCFECMSLWKELKSEQVKKKAKLFF